MSSENKFTVKRKSKYVQVCFVCRYMFRTNWSDLQFILSRLWLAMDFYEHMTFSAEGRPQFEKSISYNFGFWLIPGLHLVIYIYNFFFKISLYFIKKKIDFTSFGYYFRIVILKFNIYNNSVSIFTTHKFISYQM